MAPSRRKNDAPKGGGLGVHSSRKMFYRELQVYDVGVEEESEQVLLSPTESELLCPVDKPFLNVVGSLERRRNTLREHMPSALDVSPSPSSLLKVMPFVVPANEARGKHKKHVAKQPSILDILDDPTVFQISEIDSTDNIILRLPVKSTVGKTSPDTLANLIRLAMRRGLLGPYFRGLAYEDPAKLLLWQNEFMEAQSEGSEPPIDALLEYVRKTEARRQGKGAHSKASVTRAGSEKSPRSRGRGNASDTRVKSWSLLRSKRPTGQPRPPLYLSDAMEEYGGVETDYPSNGMLYGQGKDWLTPGFLRKVQAGRGGSGQISPGFLQAIREEGRGRRPKSAGPPGRKPHLLPEIPGVEYDRTLFDGWDFGKALGPQKMTKLPGLSERATQLIQRRPPKIPIDNYVKPSANSRTSSEEYLAKFAIHELLQFLMYVIVRERPDKPIDYMIDMTRVIKRLVKIREKTEVRMNEMDRAREMRQPA